MLKAVADGQFKATQKIPYSWRHLDFADKEAALHMACKAANGKRVFFYPTAGSEVCEFYECPKTPR